MNLHHVTGIALSIVALTLSRSAAQVPDRPEVLPLDEEIRIALSAAPEHLRDSAGVWVMTANGYARHRPSENGFTCIINRDHPLNRKPVCYDAEGTRAILPKVVFVGDLLLQGTPLSAVNARVEEGFASGRFRSPQRPGVAYMLTTEIRSYNAAMGSVVRFPPHIMFYGPNLTNRDIGAPPRRRADQPWMPFVAYPGPHAFLIVVVGDTGTGKSSERERP